MTNEYFHRGNEIDISRIDDETVVIEQFDGLRLNRIHIENEQDIEVLQALLENTIAHQYVRIQQQIASEAEAVGC